MPKVVGEIQGMVLRLGLSAIRRPHALRVVAEIRPRILVVGAPGLDRCALQAILLSHGWQTTFADTAAAGLLWQCNEPFPLILLDRDSPGRDWRELMALFAGTGSQPCVILLSKANDKNLRDEVYRCGGYEVIQTPIREDSAVKFLQAGWALWRSQNQLRRIGRHGAAAASPFIR